MNENRNKSPHLLNVKDLAARFVVNRVTIHNWLRDGRCPIPPIEGTKPPKWLAADVDAFLRGRANGGE